MGVSIAPGVPLSIGLRHGQTGLAWPFLGLLLTSEAAGEACYMPLEHRVGSSASLAPLLGRLRVNWSSKDHGTERSILDCLASLGLSMTLGLVSWISMCGSGVR